MKPSLVGTKLKCKLDNGTGGDLNHAQEFLVLEENPVTGMVKVRGRYGSGQWYGLERFYREDDDIGHYEKAEEGWNAEPVTAEQPAPPVNPKQIYGDKKPRLSLAPLSATLAQVEAQLDGALKYGWLNWRENPVEAMTYLEALIRHARLWENGEDYARDTLVDNLGAVMACCAIIIDARLHGTLIDNRKHSPQTCDLLHERGEDMVRILQEKQKEREAAKNG